MRSNRSEVNADEPAPADFVTKKLWKRSGKTARKKIAKTSKVSERKRLLIFGSSFNCVGPFLQDNSQDHLDGDDRNDFKIGPTADSGRIRWLSVVLRVGTDVANMVND